MGTFIDEIKKDWDAVSELRDWRSGDMDELFYEIMRSKPDDGVQKRRALVVDDDPLSLLYMKQVLKVLGVEAETYEHPFEARLAMKARHFDYVILDYEMPELSGTELLLCLDEFKHPDRPRNAKVFLYTGRSQCIDCSKIHPNNFQFGGIISKTVSNGDLDESIRRAISA